MGEVLVGADVGGDLGGGEPGDQLGEGAASLLGQGVEVGPEAEEGVQEGAILGVVEGGEGDSRCGEHSGNIRSLLATSTGDVRFLSGFCEWM